jgi:hypothetical protein
MYLTKETFAEQTGKGRTVVLFSSSQSVLGNKYFTELTTTFPDLPIFRVDIDKERDLAADSNIRITPLVFVFQDGEILDKYMWNQKDALICILRS